MLKNAGKCDFERMIIWCIIIIRKRLISINRGKI